MKLISLRDELARGTLLAAVRALQEMGLRPGDYWLGGGTALAARLYHRESLDIDLCMEMDKFMMFRLEISDSKIREILRKGEGRQIKISAVGFQWDMPVPITSGGLVMGHASIFADPSYEEDAVSDEQEAQHGVPLERPSWTLEKKILGRIVENDAFPARDAHDFLVCA